MLYIPIMKSYSEKRWLSYFYSRPYYRERYVEGETSVAMDRLSVLAVCLAILSGFSVSAAQDQEHPLEFMHVAEVKPGMKGYGLSVFEGSRIDTFQVEILGTMRNLFYSKHDLILARVGGAYVDKAGVIAGMSGSPIFVDGKLVGALAYSFGQMPKEPIAGITPIAQMLAITTAAADVVTDPDRMGMMVPGTVPGVLETMSADYSAAGPVSAPFLKPISVPLVISGFDPQTVEFFEDEFRQRGMIPILGGGSNGALSSSAAGDASEDAMDALVPGAAVGAQLVRGDMNIASTGTVTYRDGDTILAFGHPFLWSGALNIPMTRAEIITILPDQANSTKMSNVTEPVGAVLWDHTSGLYGQIGKEARMIPMRVDMKDGDRINQSYKFEVMMSPAWTPMLVNMTVSNTILGMGRLGGERTIRLDGRVAMRDHEDIILNDLFSGQLSLPAVTTAIMNVLNVVLDNPFVTPNIESITLTILSTNDRRVAAIEGVWFDKDEVVPGEPLELTVFLRPYRGQPIVEKLSVQIPTTITKDDVMVVVGTARALTQQELRSTPQRYRPREVDQLIKMINQRRINNKVYIKLYQANTGGILKGYEMAALPPSVLSVMNSVRTSGSFTPIREFVLAAREIQTDYVISGQSRGRLKVKR